MADNMQFQKEGQPAFQETENDNSDGSSPETNKTDQTQSSGGESKPDASKDGGSESKNLNTPPPERWVERESDWKKRFNDQEVRHTSELTKLREDFDQRFSKFSPEAKPDAPVEVPQWFGGEEDAWKQYSTHTQKLIDQAVERAVEKSLSTITERSQAEQKAIDEATKWFQDEAEAIESDKELNPQGLKVDRNKLLKTALDNKAVDPDTGKWNYRLAFKLMKPSEVFQAKKDLNERKNLANATTSDNRGESKPQAFKTSEDFKDPQKKPW